MPTHDQAKRRKAQRKGREKGCSLYISAEQLVEAGLSPSDPPPFYRVWVQPGRPRFVVNLYREP